MQARLYGEEHLTIIIATNVPVREWDSSQKC